ncbi:uncharacterized protein PG998_006264 [Apiospora kogelbergensis]|uniref:uncharacterized protein n=1 Tax=Apiospora kogelbergensis TaxID=1337665 RepID=UPI00312D9854
MGTDADDQVYLGVWTNWSRGSATMGATLTMTKNSGNILIAFTAIFVPFVASRLWKMLCFAFHNCASKRGAQDAIYHQRQVILRNSTSPDSSLLSLLALVWAWRRLQSNALGRLFPLLLFAFLFIVGFTIAGGYSSQITSAAGDEVLINGNNCALIGMQSSYNDYLEASTWTSAKMSEAANYAQQCYTDQTASLLDCNRFVVKRLPTQTLDEKAGCPFPSNICRDNATNIRMDTGYIDSNDHLGLNAPPGQRFTWRKVLSCAPLRTDGYTSSIAKSNKTFIRYHYGIQTIFDRAPAEYKKLTHTLSVPDLKSQYSQIEDGVVTGLNLRISDAWYRADHMNGTLAILNETRAANTYFPTEAASPMGCVQQYQWCNSEYPRSLSSQSSLIQGIQLPLSEDQWKLDVSNWWNITLAYMQAAFVDTALGFRNADAHLKEWSLPPANDAERHLCQSQKIRHVGYASFNLFGLLFTFILGAMIIMVSFALDPIMRILHRRRRYKQYQYLEWRTNSSLQLQRLTQEELGYGKWSGCTNMVPITRPKDPLANLDISDLEYPRLNQEFKGEAKLEAYSPTVSSGSEQLSEESSEASINDPDVGHTSYESRGTSGANDIPAATPEEPQRPKAHRVSMISVEETNGAQTNLHGAD